MSDTTLTNLAISLKPKARVNPSQILRATACSIIAAGVITFVSEVVSRHGILSSMLFTSTELAERDADAAMMRHVTISKMIIACPNADITADDLARFRAMAKKNGWFPVTAAGKDCVDP